LSSGRTRETEVEDSQTCLGGFPKKKNKKRKKKKPAGFKKSEKRMSRTVEQEGVLRGRRRVRKLGGNKSASGKSQPMGHEKRSEEELCGLGENAQKSAVGDK